jgi:hypothetical protein
MKRPVPVESASRLIDERIKELGDRRGKTLAKVRQIIHAADPEIVEEWKWRGTPIWSHGGIVCTGETYNNVVKMTFAKGAALEDPSGLFNSSLEGNVRRAIDIHEGDKVNEAALKDLIRAAVALNLKGKSKPGYRAVRGKPKPRRASSKRASPSRGDGPPPCLLESYGRQAEGSGPAFRSVRAGRPQGGRRADRHLVASLTHTSSDPRKGGALAPPQGSAAIWGFSP